MHLYPILFKPIIKKMIWGQESWDVSCRPNEMSVIENGTYAGMDFESYLNLDREKTLGTRLAASARFPLLIKIITADEALSVQVHPDDDYAKKQASLDSGKSEMWYILKAPTDGKLIIGLNDDVNRHNFLEIFEKGKDVTQHLNYLPVKEGDIINIPAGLVHALTPGTVIAEIQQNSDTTYRIYDYGRLGLDGKPRELHINHAMAVIDFDGRIPKEVTAAVQCRHFAAQKYILEETRAEKSDPEAFTVIINVEGEFVIECEKGETTVSVNRSVFIPAGMGEYLIKLSSRAVALKCTVPAKK
jgi:mannose-6-phosphate isomerase